MLEKNSLPFEAIVTPPAVPPARGGRLVADASLLLTAVIWGINIPVVKYATREIEPLVFNASRMVLSTIVLALMALVESRWLEQPAARFSKSRFIMFALISGLWYPLLFMIGIDYTTAGNTALLLSSMPLWTAVISAVFIRERLPRLSWLAMMIAFLGTGVVVVAGGKVSLSAENFLGNMLILLSAMLWASGTVISVPLLKQMTPLRLAFMSSLLTMPMHILLVSTSLPAELPKMLLPHNLLALVYSGVFSTGIAYATWHIGVRRLGGSHASIYQNVVTFVAVLGGWMMLSEALLASQLLGGLLMIIGLLVIRQTRMQTGR